MSMIHILEAVSTKLTKVDEHKSQGAWSAGWIDVEHQPNGTISFDAEIQHSGNDCWEIVLFLQDAESDDLQIIYKHPETNELVRKEVEKTIADLAGESVTVNWGADLAQSSERFVLTCRRAEPKKRTLTVIVTEDRTPIPPAYPHPLIYTVSIMEPVDTEAILDEIAQIRWSELGGEDCHDDLTDEEVLEAIREGLRLQFAFEGDISLNHKFDWRH